MQISNENRMRTFFIWFTAETTAFNQFSQFLHKESYANVAFKCSSVLPNNICYKVCKNLFMSSKQISMMHTEGSTIDVFKLDIELNKEVYMQAKNMYGLSVLKINLLV